MSPPANPASVLQRSLRPAGALAWVVVALTTAAEPPLPGGNLPLDEAFRTLAVLELGQDLQMFRPIREAVAASRTDAAVRADLEARLIGILRGEATALAKDYACRELTTVGTDAAVDALAALLPDPRMSYMARYALEGIGSPAVARALRERLSKTEGPQQVGVVISLGRLADADAVSAIAALLEQGQAEGKHELCEVCVTALGRIGTVPAAQSLRAFAGRAPGMSPTLVDAQLAAALSLVGGGERELAAEICESLLATDCERVRGAAFRGLIAARPSESLAMIVAGLRAAEAWKRAVAADCLVEIDEPVRLEQIAAAIPELPADGRIAALVSLANRREPAIRQAALKSLDCPQVAVVVAALAALVRSGTADDVLVLTAIVTDAEDPHVRDAAFETLRLMPGDSVNQAMMAWLDQTADPPAVMVRCALTRRSPEFVPAFLKAVESPRAEVRLEAWKALEIMAAGEHAPALVARWCKTPPGDERDAADRAVWMSCQRIADPAQRSAPLLAALEAGDEHTPVAILPTLARIGGEEALPAVRKAMQSANPSVRDAGYRALANWPDAAVAEELLEIAKTGDVETYRIWALRAYARLVALPGDRPPQATFEMLREAMPLATRREDKELFLSRLAAVRVPDALALLLSFVDDPQFRKAAVPAVFTLAKGLSQSHPELAAAALTKIQPIVEDPATEQQIPRVLRDIEARRQKPQSATP